MASTINIMKRYIKHISIALLLILAGSVTFSYSVIAAPTTGTGATSGVQSVPTTGNTSANNSGTTATAAPQTGGAPTVEPKSNNVTFYGLNVTDAVNSFLANIINDILSAVAFLVTIAGALLSISIVVTLHIKEFVSATPAIYTAWKILRDITGLFFIFFLLYAGIKMILGRDSNIGTLIKDIVIAAILVNFSFFIISVGIDASNVVSQAIYNSIIPSSATSPSITNLTTLSGLATSVTGLGTGTNTSTPSNPNISNIFMNSLKIQTLYNSTGNSTGVAVGSPFKIILIGVFGILIMITTALSFVLAAGAFIARIVVLLGVLAFSPLIFLGEVIPQIKDKGAEVKKIFISQLLFMPVYLLLMYVALSVLNNSHMLSAANATTSTLPTGTNWAFGYVVLAVNFVIVILLLNAPLVVGLSLGGVATGWMSKAMKNFNAVNVWKGVGGFAGTNTIGRGANWVDKKLANTAFGNSYYGRSIRANTTGAVANAKYGGSKTWEDKAKIIKDVDRKAKEIDKRRDLNRLLSTSGAATSAHADIIKKMNEKERLGLGADTLKRIEVAKHLKGSDFEAVKKSDEFTDEEKKDIADARIAALDDAITKGEDDVIKHMVNNMDGKDLMGLDRATNTQIKNPLVIKHLSTGQLKTMEDQGLDPTVKQVIGNEITTVYGPGGHKAYGFIKKNPDAWL